MERSDVGGRATIVYNACLHYPLSVRIALETLDIRRTMYEEDSGGKHAFYLGGPLLGRREAHRRPA